MESHGEDRVAWKSYLSKALAYSLSLSLSSSLQHLSGDGRDREREREGPGRSEAASATDSEEKLFKQAMFYCKHDVSTYGSGTRQSVSVSARHHLVRSTSPSFNCSLSSLVHFPQVFCNASFLPSFFS